MLYDHAVSLGVDVTFGKHVQEYIDRSSKSKAGVVTSADERFEADLVVAADGVGSTSWRLIQETQSKPRSSGFAVYRVALETPDLATLQPCAITLALLACSRDDLVNSSVLFHLEWILTVVLYLFSSFAPQARLTQKRWTPECGCSMRSHRRWEQFADTVSRETQKSNPGPSYALDPYTRRVLHQSNDCTVSLARSCCSKTLNRKSIRMRWLGEYELQPPKAFCPSIFTS